MTGDPSFEPPGGQIDLLVSTDVLSEGQNLQEAQAVLSYDLPWNPQRVVQRNGRIIRLASPHDDVFLYTMLPKHGDLEDALKLEARVRGKIAAANATFGMESQVLSDLEAASKAYSDAVEGAVAESRTTSRSSSRGSRKAMRPCSTKDRARAQVPSLGRSTG